MHCGRVARRGSAGGAAGAGVKARPGLSAFGLGLLSALALPPLHVLPVLWIAVPGLLYLIGTAPGVWGAAQRGFWFGLGHHLIGLYWITEAIMLESARYWWLVPLAVPALSALMAVFIAIPCGLARLVTGWRRLALFAGSWVLFDLARQFFGTGFPWNPWGSVWAIPGRAGDMMIQPAAWVGTPGLTLATVLVAGLPWLGRRGWVGAGVVLTCWAGLGAWRLRAPTPPPTGIMAVVVQGNVSHDELRGLASAREAFERYLRLTKEGVRAAGGRPSVVIWPESAAILYDLVHDGGARAAIVEAARPALGVIAGGLRFADPGGQRQAPYNSMIALSPDGTVAGVYDKWHLVPFGEFAPSWAPFAIQIVPGQFAFGSGPATLRIPGVPPFGGMICYEVIFPGQVVDEANRPEWLVNITNDSWFGNSAGPRQHLSGARLRAVEEGLPLLRAANTGISAGFDAQGRELGRLDVGVAGTLVLEVPGGRPPTSFSRHGLVIPGLLALMLAGSSLSRARHFSDP